MEEGEEDETKITSRHGHFNNATDGTEENRRASTTASLIY
jgi:hypothetical protein